MRVIILAIVRYDRPIYSGILCYFIEISKKFSRNDPEKGNNISDVCLPISQQLCTESFLWDEQEEDVWRPLGWIIYTT